VIPLTSGPNTVTVSPSEGKVNNLALVKLRDNESFEQAFRRFKKSCEKSGILSEVKKREHYEKPSVRLKKKSISARKRLIKKLKKQQTD
jgi:small subunit ribosomal protein S21